MPIAAGIDEVGYGPKLGPLVVAAAAFRVDDPSVNLWNALATAVSDRRTTERLPVLDSKELYSSATGVGTLEPTALAFLGLLPDRHTTSFRRLLEVIALDPPAASDPWYREADFELPQVATRTDLNFHTQRLGTACVRAAAAVHGCWTAWAEPADLNRAVASGLNKSHFLFGQACRLVKAILESAPGEDVIVRIGKQGGRRLYLAGLVREFGTVWVHGETAATSRYEFREGGRRVLLEFLMDGERRDFGISLASIIGKYLREGAMRLFNAYWARQSEGLRATAGYGADARRFFREIEPHLERLRIAPDAVLRKR